MSLRLHSRFRERFALFRLTLGCQSMDSDLAIGE